MSEATQFDGAAGTIEGLLDRPREAAHAVAIICHPHPLFQGTMHNKVAYMLARACTDAGALALRFNFRGVGASSGVHDEGDGETDDAVSAADWLCAQHPGLPLWLGGFSFGGMVALRAALRLTPARLVTVAPSVKQLAGAARPDCPWLLAQGDADDVVGTKAVLDWAQAHQPQPDIERFAGVGHFFHGSLTDLRTTVSDWLTTTAPATR